MNLSPMICPNCQTENPSSARFCANCGKALVMRCSNCEAELAAGAHFCMYCGQSVRAKTADDDARHASLAAAAPTPLAEKARDAVAAPAGVRGRIVALDVVRREAQRSELDVETWS